MLKAILEGKAGRVVSEGSAEDQSWRDIFRKREDLLTAVFFGRLRYLSQEGEQKVLTLLVGAELAQLLGCVEEISFWPRLKGLKGRKHVEPDLLIRFEDSMLLVEVKPTFGGNQNEDQWIAQIESLILQRDLESAEIRVPDEFHFLALGRNTFESQQSAEDLVASYSDQGLGSANRREWDEVCRGIRQLSNDEQGRDLIIYRDWLDAFALFGLIEQPLPFDDLLKLEQVTVYDWRAAMRAFKVPMIKRSSTSIDWQGLDGLTKNIRLEVKLWK